MKKLALVFLAFLVIVSCVGCDKAQEEEIVSCTSDAVLYTYDEFMSIYGQNSDAELNAKKVNLSSDIIVPRLVTDGFYCVKVSVDDHSFDFSYNSVDIPKDSRFIRTYGIFINVSMWETAFEESTDELQKETFRIEQISDKYAYSEGLNRWYINFDGNLVSIDFPDDIQFSDPEKISDYFEFEILNPSNDNTVTQ